MPTNNHDYIFDAALELKDSGAVGSSAAATVDGSAKILDMGASGYYEGTVVIDVSAIEIDSDNEIYTIGFEVSSSATFASGIEEIAAIRLGAHEVLTGDVDTTVGRYFLRVSNERAGTLYRYARLYTTVGGTIGGTGITYSAFLAKD